MSNSPAWYRNSFAPDRQEVGAGDDRPLGQGALPHVDVADRMSARPGAVIADVAAELPDVGSVACLVHVRLQPGEGADAKTPVLWQQSLLPELDHASGQRAERPHVVQPDMADAELDGAVRDAAAHEGLIEGEALGTLAAGIGGVARIDAVFRPAVVEVRQLVAERRRQLREHGQRRGVARTLGAIGEKGDAAPGFGLAGRGGKPLGRGQPRDAEASADHQGPCGSYGRTTRQFYPALPLGWQE